MAYEYNSAPQHKVLMCPKCGYVRTGMDTDINIECKVCHASNLIVTDYDWDTYENTNTDFDVYIQHYKVREAYLGKGLDPHHIALREEQEAIYRQQYITQCRTPSQQPSQAVTYNTIPINRNPGVECPYCHSMNTTKISGFDKVIDNSIWGIFGTKRHKQWHCNNCRSDF